MDDEPHRILGYRTMTTAHVHRRSDPAEPVEPIEVTCGSGALRLSGLIARAAQPRAAVLAVHGGGSGAAYWDGQTHPDQSLLRLAAQLGFTALALDLPGYGASTGRADRLALPERAELLAEAAATALGRSWPGDGLLLVAHSQGSQLATHLGAHLAGVLGIEVSGTGLHPLRSFDTIDTTVRRNTFRAIWGGSQFYPPGTLDRVRRVPSAPFELQEARTWAERLPEVAAAIAVPVRITMAEHEGFWPADGPALARLAALFTAAPRVETAHQPAAPHNISLSYAARAYHLRVLGFAEECRTRPR